MGGEDQESREKPKVAYICGGKHYISFNLSKRLWEGAETRQGLTYQVHALRPQNLLQEERKEDPPVPCSLNLNLYNDVNVTCLIILIKYISLTLCLSVHTSFS